MTTRGYHGLLLSGGWSPASLFSGGARGAWFDFNDLSTLFQDTAGTTPVTAAGQSVALAKDKSGNSQHISQGTAGNRPVLQNDGTSYYLQFTASSSQWLEIANTNSLYPGTQSLLGLVANAPTSSASTAYSRALAGSGNNRYTIGQASSKADSGAYQWPSSNTDAQTGSVISANIRNVMSQTIDRSSGVNKIWYLASGGSSLAGTASVDIGSTNLNSAYRFRVGAYGNGSDSGVQSLWDGRIYGVLIVMQSAIDYTARSNAEAWMMSHYGF